MLLIEIAMLPLDVIIMELLARGYKLPKRLYSAHANDDLPEDWLLLKYVPKGADGREIAHKDAHALVAMAFLQQVQAHRPVLKTNVHGDWYLELAHVSQAPATHWDIPPYETIIKAIHASELPPAGFGLEVCK